MLAENPAHLLAIPGPRLVEHRQPLALVAPKTSVFPTLSGLATGLCWLCCFQALAMGNAARVALIDKLRVKIVAMLAFRVSHCAESVRFSGAVHATFRAMRCSATNP